MKDTVFCANEYQTGMRRPRRRCVRYDLLLCRAGFGDKRFSFSDVARLYLPSQGSLSVCSERPGTLYAWAYLQTELCGGNHTLPQRYTAFTLLDCDISVS